MKKKKHKIRPTSILAYYEVLKNLGERHEQVYRAIRDFNHGGCNNKMIAEHLNLPINCITGRVEELRKMGLVIHYKKDHCPIALREEGKKRLTIFWRVRRRI